MTVSARQPGDRYVLAGLTAYLVFAVSGGVYAGTEGLPRAVALAVALAFGVLAPVAFALTLVRRTRAGAGPRRSR